MEIIEATPLDGGFKRREYATDPPPGARVVSDCVIVDPTTGKTLALHARLPDVPPVVESLRGWFKRYRGWEVPTPNGGNLRLSGIKNSHQTFGTVPSAPLRRRWGAGSSRFSRANPNASMALEQTAAACARYFKNELPDLYANQLDLIDPIDPAWLLGKGSAPWTSGIINKTAALPYHRDSGNVQDSWSAMIVLRENIAGGHLHLPDLDLWLACDDLSVSIFNGQGHLHGVTPFQRTHHDGYRFSIVFYAKRDLIKALPPGEELKRAQRRATEATEATK